MRRRVNPLDADVKPNLVQRHNQRHRTAGTAAAEDEQHLGPETIKTIQLYAAVSCASQASGLYTQDNQRYAKHNDQR